MKHKKRIAIIVVTLLTLAAAIVVYEYLIADRGPGREAAGGRQPQEAKGGGGGKGGGGRVVPVEVCIADYELVDNGQRVTGTLLANETVDIASETSGKVEKIFFQEGGRVKKGAVLVKVNDDDLQAQLKRAKYQARMLKDKLERSRILFSKDAISREAFDQIETDYNVLMADLQLLEVRIDKTEIKAPFDGVVGFRYIAPGSYLQPNTLIVKLVDESQLKLEFSIPEKYYGRVGVGYSVSFTVKATEGVHWARVYAVDPQIYLGTRTITARALYDNSAHRMLPGMSADMTIGRESGKFISIPTEAVVPQQEGMAVWVVDGGRATLRRIATGLRDESQITVTRGLVKGDSVIITGLLQLKEGAAVQVN